jgi:hypothetical protein
LPRSGAVGSRYPDRHRVARGGPDKPSHDEFEPSHDEFEPSRDEFEPSHDEFEPSRDDFEAGMTDKTWHDR